MVGQSNIKVILCTSNSEQNGSVMAFHSINKVNLKWEFVYSNLWEVSSELMHLEALVESSIRIDQTLCVLDQHFGLHNSTIGWKHH
jgi:hypothetical protein